MRASESLHVEGRLSASPARRAETASKLRLGHELLERGGELVRVAWPYQQARPTAVDHLGDAADPGGDHRQTGGHGFQHRYRQSLGPARENEDVRSGEQRRNVPPLAGQPHMRFGAEPADFTLELRPVGTLADDQRLERFWSQRAESADEGNEVLRRLESSYGHDQRCRPVVTRLRGPEDIDRVRDHHGSIWITGTSRDAGRLLTLGDADRRGRQRRDEAIGPAVKPGREARVRCERPAVDGEHADRNAHDSGGEASENPRLGAARVDDVGSFPPQQACQLDQAEEIAQRTDRAADVLQRNEASSRSGRCFAERAEPVGGDHHVETLGERRKQRGDVALGSACLGERDREHEPRPPGC